MTDVGCCYAILLCIHHTTIQNMLFYSNSSCNKDTSNVLSKVKDLNLFLVNVCIGTVVWHLADNDMYRI